MKKFNISTILVFALIFAVFTTSNIAFAENNNNGELTIYFDEFYYTTSDYRTNDVYVEYYRDDSGNKFLL